MNDEKRGLFLQQLRNEAHLTQKELGDKLHYSDKTISKWEQGKTLPNNPETLDELCKIYNVSIEELLYGERKTQKNQNEITSNMEKVYKSDYNKYKTILNLSLILILFIIIITMLSIYFIFIKGKILSYVIEGENDHFAINKSTLLLTDKIDTLSLSKVISKNNEQINYIRLYYVKDSKEYQLFKGENNGYYIEESEGYKEYNLNNLKDSELYIEINYDSDIIEIIKLDISQRFINNKIFYSETNNISDDNEQFKITDEKLVELLLKEDFMRNDDLYEKTYANNRITYNQDTKTIMIFNTDNIKYEQIKYRFQDDFISYEYIDNDENINSYIYYISDELSSSSNDFLKFCYEYISYIINSI